MHELSINKGRGEEAQEENEREKGPRERKDLGEEASLQEEDYQMK